MALEQVTDEITLESVFKSRLAVLFKHSSICAVSGIAMEEMQNFAADHPDVPVYMVDVITHKPLSQKAARYLGVTHQSPQVIIIRDAAAVWNGSHYEVTARRVAGALPQD